MAVMRDMYHNAELPRPAGHHDTQLGLKRLASGPRIEGLYRVLTETNRFPGVEVRRPHALSFTKALGLYMLRAREIKYIPQFKGIVLDGLFDCVYSEVSRAGDSHSVLFDDCRIDANARGERFLVVSPNAVSQDRLANDRNNVREAVMSYLPRRERKGIKWNRSAIDMTLAFAPSMLPQTAESKLEAAWGDVSEYIKENPLPVTLGPIVDERHYRSAMEAEATG